VRQTRLFNPKISDWYLRPTN